MVSISSADKLTYSAQNFLQLREDLKSATEHWQPIGKELNVDTAGIKAIFRQDEHACMRNMLIKWLQTNRATWDILIAALKAVQQTIPLAYKIKGE